MAKLVGPTGVRGIDVTTESGTKKYNADSKGFINIENGRHAKQAKAEGFFEASGFAGIKSQNAWPCVCGHNSLFKVCGKCGKDNG
jgi:hypothetical protein